MVKLFRLKSNIWFALALVVVSVFLLANVSLGIDGKININTASLEELDSLPDIGPTKAQAIIDYRKQNGLFSKIEDIMNVPGIGEAIFNEIKDLITIEEINDEGSGDSGNKISCSQNLLINELMPNPSSSDDNEWIELYNSGTTTADVALWQIADNSKTFIISATGTFATIIEAHGFLVIPRAVSGISLNNTGGEGVTLKNSDGVVVSQTSYSDSASDDYAWARNESGGYEWTTTATKNTINIITKPMVSSGGSGGGSSASSSNIETSSVKESGSGYVGKILITEILSNPVGLDGEDNEWLEIYNTSTAMVILDGWKLKDNFGVYSFKETKIEPKSFLILSRGQTQLILNNEHGESLELLDNNGKSVAKVSYKTVAPEGKSYNLCGRSWEWRETVTPGVMNDCPIENELPEAYFEAESQKVLIGQTIILNADESYDSDGKIVKYRWNFSESVVAGQATGQEMETPSAIIGIKFLQPGIKKITLTVVDNLLGEGKYSEEIEVAPDGAGGDYSNIFINELLPNPKGVDAGGEWLELYNGSSQEVNLKNFSLAVEKGKTYKIADDLEMAKGSYLVLNDKRTKLVLFNAGGRLSLIDPQGKVIREINYGKTTEGRSYARDEEKGSSWAWTSGLTPGARNNIVAVSKIVAGVGASPAATGGTIKFVGIVTTEPGLLGKTIFYAEEASGRGAQIYSYYKDFPNLIMGDKVEIIGTVSDYQGERRIKTKSKNDIRVTGSGDPLTPRRVQVEDIGEEIEGALVEIVGELVEKKGSTWWVDDGTEEVKVYLKENTGIKGEGLEVGDELKIIGIVSQYKDEYRLLPRFQDDVKVVSKKVLGATVEAPRASSSEDSGGVMKYLLAIAVAVILGLVTYIIKSKMVGK